MNARVREIGQRIRTQDNLATELPIFCVQSAREIANDNSDTYKWVDDDFNEVDSETAKQLDASSDEKEGYTKFHYIIIWEFVTACFTRQGCLDYIAVNGHNIGNHRIYVASGYRNAEWRDVRDYLLNNH